MDWILKTSGKDRAGIEWPDGEKLSDLTLQTTLLSLKTHGKECKPRHQKRETKSWIKRNRRVSRILQHSWAAPSPTTEVVTGRLWYYRVKPTVYFDGWGWIWASRKIKLQLYNSLILAVLYCGAETWPMIKSKLTIRKLEAAHHRWLRKILHISWTNKVTNEKVRELAQQGIIIKQLVTQHMLVIHKLTNRSCGLATAVSDGKIC